MSNANSVSISFSITVVFENNFEKIHLEATVPVPSLNKPVFKNNQEKVLKTTGLIKNTEPI